MSTRLDFKSTRLDSGSALKVFGSVQIITGNRFSGNFFAVTLSGFFFVNPASPTTDRAFAKPRLSALEFAPVGAGELAGEAAELQFGEDGQHGGNGQAADADDVAEVAGLIGKGVENYSLFGIELFVKH